MNVDFSGVRLILCRRGFHDRVKNGPLAGKVVIKRGRLDADRPRDLAHADRIVSLLGKQLQRLFQNPLPCILLLHHFTS